MFWWWRLWWWRLWIRKDQWYRRNLWWWWRRWGWKRICWQTQRGRGRHIWAPVASMDENTHKWWEGEGHLYFRQHHHETSYDIFSWCSRCWLGSNVSYKYGDMPANLSASATHVIVLSWHIYMENVNRIKSCSSLWPCSCLHMCHGVYVSDVI